MHKFWNFSQHGVGGDPVFVHSEVADKFKHEFQNQAKRQHGVYPRANYQVAPAMRFSGGQSGGGTVELNELKNKTEERDDEELGKKVVKKQGEMDEPLMQDDQGSSIVTMTEFNNIEDLIIDLKRVHVSGVHYYGSTNSAGRKLLEERLRSSYFLVNESPLQPCNVFAPLGHHLACGLGTIKGIEGEFP